MFRRSLLAIALMIGLLSVGCMRSAPEAPRPVAPQPAMPAAPQPDSPPAPVSSMISLVKEPWLTAPAYIGAFPQEVRITFSAPVDRGSVAAKLKERLKEFPYTVAWQGDQELTLNPEQGCAYLEISVAGALDARGNRLGEPENPTLNLGLPCEGSGYKVVTLPEGKPFPGFPQNGLAVDTDAASGRLLGRNGTIYFLVEAGQVRALAHTSETYWARFLADGSVLLGDGDRLRQVSPVGKAEHSVTLSGKVLAGALSPDGKQAILMLPPPSPDATAGFIRFDLTAWTASPVMVVSRPVTVAAAALSWPAGSDWVSVSSRGPAPWLLNPQTGDTKDAGSVPPVYSPDSRMALFADGRVVEMTTGKEVANITPLSYCPPPQPSLVGRVGDQLVAAFSDPCH